MGAYLEYDILHKNTDGEISISTSQGSGVQNDPFRGKSRSMCTLLCSRNEGFSLKPCNGAHPWVKEHNAKNSAAAWWSSNDNYVLRYNTTWYTLKELHGLLTTNPEALAIVGEEFMKELYGMMEEQPEAILQFWCDQ